jgi:uncharacterized protein YbjQ (UPF0145 family)
MNRSCRKKESKMKGLGVLVLFLFLSLSGLVNSAEAEDRVLKFPVKHALSSKLGKEKMLDDIRVYMVGQGHPGVDRSYREYQSNKRSNGLSDQAACDKAFLSAIIGLQQRADREGGNAVIDIFSVTNNKKLKSSDTYSCLRGRSMANVILRGTVVRLD